VKDHNLTQYRQALAKGYFFHQMPEELNFSEIPMEKLKEFRERHLVGL
jgi:hypothetical protein